MKEQKISCPRHQIEMKQIKRDEITVDICPKCGGMWLDQAEIPKLLKQTK